MSATPVYCPPSLSALAKSQSTLRSSAGSEAGLTVFASEPSHYDMFVTQKTDGSKTVALRYRLNELTHIEKELSLPHDCKKAILRVTASPTVYSFSASTDGGKSFQELWMSSVGIQFYRVAQCAYFLQKFREIRRQRRFSSCDTDTFQNAFSFFLKGEHLFFRNFRLAAGSQN